MHGQQNVKKYRKLVKYLKENIFSCTHQIKEERAYKFFIKYVRHSTDFEDMKQELSELGHNERHIINTQYRTTNEPLNLFFVDLELAENKKEIYNINIKHESITKQNHTNRASWSK